MDCDTNYYDIVRLSMCLSSKYYIVNWYSKYFDDAISYVYFCCAHALIVGKLAHNFHPTSIYKFYFNYFVLHPSSIFYCIRSSSHHTLQVHGRVPWICCTSYFIEYTGFYGHSLQCETNVFVRFTHNFLYFVYVKSCIMHSVK